MSALVLHINGKTICRRCGHGLRTCECKTGASGFQLPHRHASAAGALSFSCPGGNGTAALETPTEGSSLHHPHQDGGEEIGEGDWVIGIHGALNV